MKHIKATRQQLKQHNQQLVLRCVYHGTARSRAAIASVTGLAKPTVSDIVTILLEQGLLVEAGPGLSTDSGGKRPTLLEFVPGARHVIGLSIDMHTVEGVLASLNGTVLVRHRIRLGGATGEAALTLLHHTLNALLVQVDAPVLCVGVGVPGLVNSAAGIVEQADSLGWQQLALAQSLFATCRVPVYCANNTELVTRAHIAYGSASDTLVTVLVNHGVEIGMAAGSTYRHSLDAGLLLVGRSNLAGTLGADAFQQRAGMLRHIFTASRLGEDMTYVDVRAALRDGDRLANQLVEEISDLLAEVYAWIIALMRPAQVALAGSITDLGGALLERIQQKLYARLPGDAPRQVALTLTSQQHSRMVGAVVLALQQELGLP
ncbi:MAG: ROK family protein [Anaerolineae bacterium]|jgi:predicted NBD/HSP70 family sugar kinase|nr:ROK family protein [Anaerolineae bacterium]